MNLKITQDHIDDFFNGKIKERTGLFPLFIRQLILASLVSKNILNCWCPVMDGTRVHGFDIDLETSDSNNWIPENKSVWELGIDADCKAKANSDWESALKREWPKKGKRKDYTFVFVTPRIWAQKEKNLWIEEKKQANVWRDVKVLDAVNLETWLGVCPIVAHNFAIKMGIASNDFISAAEYIDRFVASIVDRNKKAKLIIAGRSQYKDKISEWFFSNILKLNVYAESRREAGLFIASTALLYQNTLNEDLLSRLVFIEKPESLEVLKSNQGEQIVIPLNKEVEKLLITIKSPNLRFISLNIFNIFSFIEEPWKINLGEISAKSVAPILEEIGKSEQDARRIAKETKGSFHFLEWMLEEDIENAPLWYNKTEYSILFAALWLIGTWDERNEYDVLIVEELTQLKYSEIEKVVNSLLNTDGPFEKFGSMVEWKGWSYCLTYIANNLSDPLLKQYKELLLTVLNEIDPSVTLPPEEQWLANIKKKIHPASIYIREGLISSFVLLSLNSDNFPSKNLNYFVEDIINKLFKGKEKELGFRWASLSHWLGDIAEASPNDFLNVCEKLIKDKIAISSLFISNNDLFTRSYHCNLLWALERLAWHEDYFTRIVMILAKLHDLNFEVKVVNTPMNTLRQLFLPWLTCTLADLKLRKETFITLAKNSPDTAWNLGCKILPSSHQVGSPIAKPKWHNWLKNGVPKRTNKEYVEFTEFILLWMINYTKNNIILFKDLIDSYSDWHQFSQKSQSCFLKELKGVDLTRISEDEKTTIYDSIRKFTTRHREFSDAKWALTEEILEPFDELEIKFAPNDLLKRNIWLFESWPELPNKRKMTHEEREQYLFLERKKILETLYSEIGLQALLKKLEFYKDKNYVIGSVLANINIAFNDEKYLIKIGLNLKKDDEDTQLLSLVSSYISQKYIQRGEEWLNKILSKISGWNDDMYLNLFLALPSRIETWKLINKYPTSIKKRYWKSVRIYRGEPEELNMAVEELRKVNRPCMAIFALASLEEKKYEDSVESEVVYDVLLESLQVNSDFKTSKVSMLGYYICILLNYLEHKGYEHSKLAEIEWALLPLLKHEHGRGLKSLQYCLNNEPKFLIDLLKIVFKGRHEEVKNTDFTEAEQQKANQAYDLLTEWKQPPYTEFTDNNEANNKINKSDDKIYFNSGNVDKKHLAIYLKEVRKLAKECDRLEVCESQLGSILAYTPKDVKNIWPCSEVCKILEEIDSDELFHSLESGVFNKRGVHRVAKGGANEFKISEQFKRYAEARKVKYQKTAAMLSRISKNYKAEAKRVQERERFQDFWE